MTFRRVVKVLSVIVLISAAALISRYCYLLFNGYLYGTVTIRSDLTPQKFLQVRKWLKNSTVSGRRVVIDSMNVDGATALEIGKLMHQYGWKVEVEIRGEISPQTFIQVRKWLESPAVSDKTVVVDSTGGDMEAAIAIGILIHKYDWNVRVENRCYSSCAIFIFPAGQTKYLTKSAMLLFHGGPHQENLQKLLDSCLPVNSGRKTQDVVNCGVKDKEGVVTWSVGDEKEFAEIRNFLSIPLKSHSAEEAVNAMVALSDGFYKELGVNPLIGNYGQTGKYKEIYESYKYNGFVYSLDSLNKLGVGNIQLVDGEWHPELNPDYKVTYEVAYP